jgi:putative endonuclease
MPYYTYILQSEINEQFYIGQTQYIDKRLLRRNSGSVPSTKRYRPWKLVYSKTFDSRTDAIK